MKPESNRQKSTPRRTPKEQDATFARLAELFPYGTVIGDGSLSDYRRWARGEGPGRRYAVDPDDFARRRAQAVAALRRAGEKPTRIAIAERLGVHVRTLYNYDHAAQGTIRMPMTIAGPGFKIQVGRQDPDGPHGRDPSR